MSSEKQPYLALVKHLGSSQYTFICPSPETQGRVVEKRKASRKTEDAKTAEDFFGWNLSASRETLTRIIPDSLNQSLRKAGVVKPVDNDSSNYRSTIRVSNFYTPNIPSFDTDAIPLYYIHSAFPASSDSVFFGPDTYLFVSFLGSSDRHLKQQPRSIVDVCCGSGAGAIHLARIYSDAKTYGLDLNPKALGFGDVNAGLAGVDVEFHESDLYAHISNSSETQDEGIDLIVSNPPYIASSPEDTDLPIYADGGAQFGLDISYRIIEEGAKLLSAQGVMMLYTGVAIPVAQPGFDPLLDRIRKVKDVELVEYTILHPDMWPEEIGKGAYAEVGRIQAIGAVLRKSKER
ncbi:S-adenosyl-L-methionine-dependent methyltransferase [Lophiostoma macrostomum CBS 122681]|uniref:S-adenosyl-L-methionine-dependent methyltransferase n=1 Tax=Lophiostoma macrostomum CBS 122681 TaxID=1314788 RepID=A0A6A6TQY9_9PLEO|nr:S-adenosyl-L-methionine-dependent methyltransferase [Lophiostoma macrostomum CBS 122681]